MLIPDYTTIHTAKLLKKAGFPQEFKLSYGNTLIATDDGPLCRPHLWDAMRWLREEKKIGVSVECIATFDYGADVTKIFDNYSEENDLLGDGNHIFSATYEAACDAGIAAACKFLLGEDINDATKME